MITASSAMEYAFEGDELTDATQSPPSVFTSALVEGLETGDADRDQDGLVALDELYDYIYDRVRAATPNQTPGKWAFGVQGELVIARRARPVSRPAALPPELLDAIESRLASVRVAAVQELERVLHGKHAGRALAARQALTELAADDSRTVAAAAAAALSDGASPARAVPGTAAEPEPEPGRQPDPEPEPDAGPDRTRTRTRSPGRSRNPSPGRSRNPSPGRSRNPSPGRRRNSAPSLCSRQRPLRSGQPSQPGHTRCCGRPPRCLRPAASWLSGLCIRSSRRLTARRSR